MMRFTPFLLPLAALALAAAPASAIATAQPAAPTPAQPVALVPPAEVAANPANRWTITLSTGEDIVIQLRPDIAPKSVERVQLLARHGYYDGLPFHRVIDGFMAQAGNPETVGRKATPLPGVAPEFTDYPHLRGMVSMARAEALDSASGEFFIMFAPNFSLDHRYSAFGRVISGMAAVDRIERGEPPSQPTFIARTRLGDMAEVPAPVAVTTSSR